MYYVILYFFLLDYDKLFFSLKLIFK